LFPFDIIDDFDKFAYVSSLLKFVITKLSFTFFTDTPYFI